MLELTNTSYLIKFYTRKFALKIDLPYTVESSFEWFDVFVDFVVMPYA